jgi:hypothetical protein
MENGSWHDVEDVIHELEGNFGVIRPHEKKGRTKARIGED